MTLSEIRTVLRRQLQDTPAAQFSDAELNAIINEAYVGVQLLVFNADREAHIVWENIPTTINVNWYPMPETFGINRIGIKAAAADTLWTKLTKKALVDVELVDSGTKQYYVLRGQWIGIFPAPAVSISDGIQVLHTPVMQLAIDSDVPKVKRPLHMAILWLARLYAQDEDEAVDLTKVEARLQSLLNSIPQWYNVNSDAADQLSVNIGTTIARNRDNSINIDN